MKNKTITLIFGIFLISFISANVIYSGESINITLEKPFAYYSIVGNSTEVILDIQQNGNNVIITPNKYSSNDSYEIIFFDITEEIINVYSSGGSGGGTRTIIKEKNVTEYVEVPVKEIEYVDKEIEVMKKEVPLWIFIFFFLCALLITTLLWKLHSKEDIAKRRYENE